VSAFHEALRLFLPPLPTVEIDKSGEGRSLGRREVERPQPVAFGCGLVAAG
jgi:hypothetical protein